MRRKTELIIVTTPLIREHRFISGAEEHGFPGNAEEHRFLSGPVEEHRFLEGLVEEHRFIGGMVEEERGSVTEVAKERTRAEHPSALEHKYLSGSPEESSIQLTHPHRVSRVTVQRRADGSIFLVLDE